MIGDLVAGYWSGVVRLVMKGNGNRYIKLVMPVLERGIHS
jgi:hypothetical protein